MMIGQGKATRLALSAAAVPLLFSASQVFAASGTWIGWNNGANGNSWPNNHGQQNWASGVIANGDGATADFSQANISTVKNVYLHGQQTVGTLIFGTPNNSSTVKYNLYGYNSTYTKYDLTLSNGTSAGVIDVKNGTLTIESQIRGSYGIEKQGAGTLIIASAGVPNTYSGPTKVSGGTLIAQGTNIPGGSQVQSLSGGAFVGTGTISSLTVDGVVGVGTARSQSVGTLAVAGHTEWNAGGAYEVSIASGSPIAPFALPAAPSGSDFFQTDTLGQNGLFTIAIEDAGFDSLGLDNYAWMIAKITGEGMFDLSKLALNVSNSWDTNVNHYRLVTNQTGDSLYVRYGATSVPEATTMFLGCAAVMPLLAHRRRRRA